MENFRKDSPKTVEYLVSHFEGVVASCEGNGRSVGSKNT